jgi:glycogen phosphorylase
MSFSFVYPYTLNPSYQTRVAYFCMEFAIHQPLKTYAGGLGFLAGSHLRSAYEMRQNMVGIGILWKYGYYNQGRKGDQTMEVLFQEKTYRFLIDTGIRFTIKISQHTVWVTAWYLPSELFQTAPVFFLSTDLPENDHLARTICHRLYDSNPETSIAAAILLGEGGAKLLDILNLEPSIYHLNESHALPLAFYLYRKYNSVEEVKKRLVFTNHTPEPSGNRKTDMFLLNRMGFWGDMNIEKVKEISKTEGDLMDHTLTALSLSKKANAVSKMHLHTIQQKWKNASGLCEILAITNGQNHNYWADTEMYNALLANNDTGLLNRKKQCKQQLFEEVADQCGDIFDPNKLTIVFAKRFAGYKRPELLFHDMDWFHHMISNRDRPVQMIWAGKPYPMDYAGIASFDKIVHVCKTYPNCVILAGYELKLSRMLKRGADVWLNTPRLSFEASGTSGMSAAMNGCVNVSMPDGWFPEFARHGINCFVIPNTEVSEHKYQQDETDAHNLYTLLEKTVIPMYYDHPAEWLSVIKNSMQDIIPAFDSNRMADEYYDKLYMA